MHTIYNEKFNKYLNRENFEILRKEIWGKCEKILNKFERVCRTILEKFEESLKEIWNRFTETSSNLNNSQKNDTSDMIKKYSGIRVEGLQPLPKISFWVYQLINPYDTNFLPKLGVYTLSIL